MGGMAIRQASRQGRSSNARVPDVEVGNTKTSGQGRECSEFIVEKFLVVNTFGNLLPRLYPSVGSDALEIRPKSTRQLTVLGGFWNPRPRELTRRVAVSSGDFVDLDVVLGRVKALFGRSSG